MSIRTHSFSDGEYYHIYNRGNSRQIIFLDDKDYGVFQQFLYLMNMEKRITTREVGSSAYSYVREVQLVHIGAYCLMPNHFHILLTQKADNGISKFMQKVSTAYVMYFNKKYKRTGGLFEGKFKSKHIGTDTYLKYLYAYIHLNPAKLITPSWKEDLNNGTAFNLSEVLEYPYSSAAYYVGKEKIENLILEPSSFPNYFPERGFFLEEISTWFRLLG